MKRIVFISCRCTSKSVDSSYDDDEEMNDESVAEDETSKYYSMGKGLQQDSLPSVNPINTMIG